MRAGWKREAGGRLPRDLLSYWLRLGALLLLSAVLWGTSASASVPPPTRQLKLKSRWLIGPTPGRERAGARISFWVGQGSLSTARKQLRRGMGFPVDWVGRECEAAVGLPMAAGMALSSCKLELDRVAYSVSGSVKPCSSGYSVTIRLFEKRLDAPLPIPRVVGTVDTLVAPGSWLACMVFPAKDSPSMDSLVVYTLQIAVEKAPVIAERRKEGFPIAGAVPTGRRSPETGVPSEGEYSEEAALRDLDLLGKVPYPEGGMEALLEAFRSCLKSESSNLHDSCLLKVRMGRDGRIYSMQTLRSSNPQIELAAKCAVHATAWKVAESAGDTVEFWLPLHADWLRLSSGVRRAAGMFVLSNWAWRERLPYVPPRIEKDIQPIFVAYDSPPEPVGGFEAIQRNLIYPDSARAAGVEGRVIVHVLVDWNGRVAGTKILKSLGPACDMAAIRAIESVEWKPAMQRGRPVTVWVAIPVIFNLGN